MCGLAGLMTRDGSTPTAALLDRLLAALAHRGPDGNGRLVRGDTALLHTRLAIVDLVTGDQPLFAGAAPGEGTALVANGEIYNNPALRADMANTPFRTRSDCEPALWRYVADGPGFADALRGMYAIAIHDPLRQHLVLARDPFGIKQLYYVEGPHGFAFASEPQALIAAGLAPRALDPQARAELLQLKFTVGAATIFPGIHRLLPGETLVVAQGRVVERRRRPALPAGGPQPIGAHDALARLDQVLLDSVTAHLQSDVPYGLFLSGGIDSAAVLALMHRATGQRIHALTCGWDGVGVDETGEAMRLAAAQGAVCERVAMGQADFWALAPRIAACIDDPTADAAVLPTWMLGRAARAAGLKVTLCGEGADELFGGYARYRKQRPPWRWLARKPRSRGALGDVPGLAGWRTRLAAYDTPQPGRSPLQAAQEADIAEWLPNDLLVKLDRCLMAHGVEGRTPFLDPEIAAFAFPLPDAQKAGLRFGKRLLRQWLARAFPEAGAFARKKGFKPPVGPWIAARATHLAPLLARQPGIAEILEPAGVAARLAAAGQGPQAAWSLLYFGLWHSAHIVGLPMDGPVDHVLAEAGRAA